MNLYDTIGMFGLVAGSGLFFAQPANSGITLGITLGIICMFSGVFFAINARRV